MLRSAAISHSQYRKQAVRDWTHGWKVLKGREECQGGRVAPGQVGQCPSRQGAVLQSKAGWTQKLIPPAMQPSPDKHEVTSEVKNQSGEHILEVRISRSRAELRDTYSRAQTGTQCSDLSLTEAIGNRCRGVSLRRARGRLVGATKPHACIQGPESKNSQSFLQVKIITPSCLVDKGSTIYHHWSFMHLILL